MLPLRFLNSGNKAKRQELASGRSAATATLTGRPLVRAAARRSGRQQGSTRKGGAHGGVTCGTGACHRASRPWTRRLLATRSTVTCVG
ncbi:hypothetical protein BHM03_00026705 [Ensete ventricosum]|nr:hypothetical protein BHM03_00026705 [Ensete ventricosum]